MSFSTLASLMREAAVNALPADVYASNRVFHDAVDQELMASNQRAANITFAMSSAEQVTCSSNPRFRVRGFLMVRLYEPARTGDKVQLTSADTIADALRNYHVVSGGVDLKMYVPSLENEPREGPMWVRSVTIPFKADTFNS